MKLIVKCKYRNGDQNGNRERENNNNKKNGNYEKLMRFVYCLHYEPTKQNKKKSFLFHFSYQI